jgi:hypothetical protein
VGRNALLSAAGLVHDQVGVVVVSGRLDDRGGDLITYSAVEESDAQELQPCRQPAVAARPSAEDAVPDAVCRSVPCNHAQAPPTRDGRYRAGAVDLADSMVVDVGDVDRILGTSF